MYEDMLSIIRDKLIADGVANSTTWKCWINYAPDIADQVISLHMTGGYPQDTHGGENVIQTFQVRVRAPRLSYSVCLDKWWQMFRCLNDANLSASDIHLIQATMSGPLEYLDEENRVNMTANFRVVRTTPPLSS